MIRKSFTEIISSTATKSFGSVTPVFFYIIIILLIAGHRPIKIPSTDFAPVWNLLRGNDQGFYPPGAEFEVFRRIIPQTETVSFISNNPFSPYDLNIARLYGAQAHLTPIVINHDPGEKVAIVDCSNKATADKRMQDEKYKLVLSVADGKGLAVKIK